MNDLNHHFFLVLVNQSIRLVSNNDLTSSSGIVEIKMNNTWKRMCYHHGWNMVTAKVACKQLGYLGALSTGCCGSFPFQPYGGNDQQSVMANIYCTGEEKFLGECQFKWSPSIRCDLPNSAGIVCSSKMSYITIINYQ